MSERCAFHEDMVCRLAKTEEQASSHDDWITKVESKMDDNLKETLKAIDGLRAEINQAKGAGWMLLKVGAAALGAASLMTLFLNLKGGK